MSGVLSAWPALLWLTGCEPYRVEYHQRPDFYYEASEGELKDEWIAPDGTVVKFTRDLLPSEEEALAQQLEASRKAAGPAPDKNGDGVPDEPELTKLWEEHEDGTVTMRAFLPQHVVVNFMQALREERYGEFYDQLVSVETQGECDSRSKGQGKRLFARWCVTNRRSIMETLNRMAFGYMKSDVILRKTGPSGYRIDFTPRLSQQFEFTSIDTLYEGKGMKFLRVGTARGNGGKQRNG